MRCCEILTNPLSGRNARPPPRLGGPASKYVSPELDIVLSLGARRTDQAPPCGSRRNLARLVSREDSTQVRRGALLRPVMHDRKTLGVSMCRRVTSPLFRRWEHGAARAGAGTCTVPGGVLRVGEVIVEERAQCSPLHADKGFLSLAATLALGRIN